MSFTGVQEAVNFYNSGWYRTLHLHETALCHVTDAHAFLAIPTHIVALMHFSNVLAFNPLSIVHVIDYTLYMTA